MNFISKEGKKEEAGIIIISKKRKQYSLCYVCKIRDSGDSLIICRSCFKLKLNCRSVLNYMFMVIVIGSSDGFWCMGRVSQYQKLIH